MSTSDAFRVNGTRAIETSPPKLYPTRSPQKGVMVVREVENWTSPESPVVKRPFSCIIGREQNQHDSPNQKVARIVTSENKGDGKTSPEVKKIKKIQGKLNFDQVESFPSLSCDHSDIEEVQEPIVAESVFEMFQLPMFTPLKKELVVSSLFHLTLSSVHPIQELSTEDNDWLERIKKSIQTATNPHTADDLRKKLDLEKIQGDAAGVSGSYFCKILTDQIDELEKPVVAIGGILKFSDEELGMKKSMFSHIERPKHGISPGKSYARECIASALHAERIPCTVKLAFTDEQGLERYASLQKFIPDSRNLHNLRDIKEESALFPHEEVCEMALVDLRLVNTDRHRGNALLPKNSYLFLYLIDQGCILSAGFKDEAVFCWSTWSQATKGFTEKHKERIAKIDLQKDRAIIRDNFPEIKIEVLKTLTFSTLFLQEAAKEDLSLRDIASIYFSVDSRIGYPTYAARLYEKIVKSSNTLEEFDEQARGCVKKTVALIKNFTGSGIVEDELVQCLLDTDVV